MHDISRPSVVIVTYTVIYGGYLLILAVEQAGLLGLAVMVVPNNGLEFKWPCSDTLMLVR